MGRARVHGARGDVELALRDLQEAASLAPDNAEAQAALALMLAANHRHAEALEPYREARRARPDDLSLLRAHARSMAASGDEKGARWVLAKAHTEHPSDLQVLLMYAEVLSRSDPEGAYGLLRSAVEAQSDPRILVALAAAARDVGKLEEAATIMERLAKVLDSEAVAETARKLRAEAQASP